MFRNLFNKADDSGFTKKDKRIVDMHERLLKEGQALGDDYTAAAAFLTAVGWTVERMERTYNHFYPHYTVEQVDAAREAFVAYKDGDVSEARATLVQAGLTLEDMRKAHQQYLAEVLAGSRPSPF